jgi:hypothetical protein
MPRRRRYEEVSMPQWVEDEAMQRSTQEERVRVPVPVRRAEARNTQYLYAQIEDETPWYGRTTPENHSSSEVSWYQQLVVRLNKHLTDMLYLKGERLDVDQTITDWLYSNHDFTRAVLIGALCEEDVRKAFAQDLPASVVNAAVTLIFS